MRSLVVTIPFESYAIGDVIPPGDETSRVLSEHTSMFVVVRDEPTVPHPAIDE